MNLNLYYQALPIGSLITALFMLFIFYMHMDTIKKEFNLAYQMFVVIIVGLVVSAFGGIFFFIVADWLGQLTYPHIL